MSKIGIGTDHGGFLLKADVIAVVESMGFEIVDFGGHDETPADYPDPAKRVGTAVSAGEVERGILLCGSGVGVAIASNKVVGVRASVCHDTYTAAQGVEHDAMNVLCLGARVIGSELAGAIVRSFLSADFSGAERHQRRLDKVLALEAAMDAC